MNIFLIILLIPLVLMILFMLLNRRPAKTDISGNGEYLRERYVEVSGLPPGPALEALRRRIEALEEEFPMRTESWYIEKALYEIERDRSG